MHVLPFLIALAAVPVEPHTPAPVAVEITVTRAAPDRWQIDYRFAEPVTALELGPPVAGYRTGSWTVATPGVRLVEEEGVEVLVADDSARTHIRLLVARHDGFDHGAYVPMVQFSDGGVALYLEFFTGVARVAGESRELAPRFRFVPRAGEHVERPAGDVARAFVYFGPQRPVADSHLRVILDPAMPSWLRDELLRASATTIDVLTEALGRPLPVPPLMLVGGADFDRYDGGSLKGGAIGDRFMVLLLRGRAFVDPTATKRAIVQRLIAHEIVHLFQAATLSGDAFSVAEPWLHEGSAEAMAIVALGASGLWRPAQVDRYAADAEAACREAIGERTLADAVRAGQGQAVYPCGLGLFWSAPGGPVRLWKALAERVNAGEPFSDATLDSVRHRR